MIKKFIRKIFRREKILKITTKIETKMALRTAFTNPAICYYHVNFVFRKRHNNKFYIKLITFYHFYLRTKSFSNNYADFKRLHKWDSR